MTPEAWRRAKELLAAAVELPTEARQAFLQQHCEDPELRAQVESLLHYAGGPPESGGGDALEGVEAALLADLEQPSDREGPAAPPSRVSSVLSHYVLDALLGTGGMGDVYRARDLRLGREVAVKILSEHLAATPQAVRRFEREARAVAALSHPNIVAIHDVGTERGLRYAVMELLEGESLRACLQRGALPWRQAVAIAIAAAEGLAAAHARGIIHRDLKPENIFLTRDGVVKVLDFGIARVTTPRIVGTSAVSTNLTQPWTVLGTPGYMAPEQVRGEQVEPTSDVFALGCVIHEMVSGRAPFARNTATETIAAILCEQPSPIPGPPPVVPASLQQIILRCLTKSPAERPQTAREAIEALQATLNVPEAAVIGDASPPAIVRRGWLEAALEPMRGWAGAAMGAAAALMLAAFGIWAALSWRAAPIDSVAVLPLVNASADEGAEYLSDGITDALIDNLSRLPQLRRVIARSTVAQYKDKAIDPRQVGRELNVGAVLTGRLTQRGEDVIVGAELVSAADGSRLWGEQFNGKTAGLIALQASITEQVSQRLRIALTAEQRDRLNKRPTESDEAQRLYLKGRYFLNRYTQAGWKEGLDSFTRAIDLDPTYALAWAGVADSYYQMSSLLLPPSDAMPKAKAAALRALQIEETLAEARAVLAVIKAQYEWDWPEAEKDYRRALALNPNYATAHQYYSWSLAVQGRFDEAIAELSRASELDPLSVLITTNLAWLHYLAGRYDESITRNNNIIAANPNFAPAHHGLALALERKGMVERAVAEWQKAEALDPESPLRSASLGYGYAVAGKPDEAQRILDTLKQQSEQAHVDPSYMALIYLGLGADNEVFAWLEKAYEVRSEEVLMLKVDPRFARLRSDPRFRSLLQRMNLAP